MVEQINIVKDITAAAAQDIVSNPEEIGWRINSVAAGTYNEVYREPSDNGQNIASHGVLKIHTGDSEIDLHAQLLVTYPGMAIKSLCRLLKKQPPTIRQYITVGPEKV